MNPDRCISLLEHEARAAAAGLLELIVRPLKPQPGTHHWECLPDYKRVVTLIHMSDGICSRVGHWHAHREDGVQWIRCPFGAPGTVLLGREVWKPHCAGPISEEFPLGTCVKYKADGAMRKPTEWTPEEGFWCEAREDSARWRFAATMPRWAVRSRLRVTDVVGKRVQNVTRFDCDAAWSYTSGFWPQMNGPTTCWEAFRFWWNHHYADRGLGWDENPWVWLAWVKQHSE